MYDIAPLNIIKHFFQHIWMWQGMGKAQLLLGYIPGGDRHITPTSNSQIRGHIRRHPTHLVREFAIMLYQIERNDLNAPQMFWIIIITYK